MASSRIIVGVDGSPSSQAAIRYAADLADRFGHRLELVHVVPQAARTGGLYAIVPDYFEDIGRTIVNHAAKQAAELIAAERVDVDLRHGMRVPALLEGSDDAAAIVLGFDARPSAERLATGSTVAGVAAHADVPVVVVRPQWSREPTHGVVTVGVKAVEDSTELLRRAFDVATSRGARLQIVHAWRMPNLYEDVIVGHAAAEAGTEAAAERLRTSAGSVATDYPDTEYDVAVVHGHPARALATMSSDADLLLLERRHHPVFRRHLGGTARTLLREASCPVQILPDQASADEGPWAGATATGERSEREA